MALPRQIEQQLKDIAEIEKQLQAPVEPAEGTPKPEDNRQTEPADPTPTPVASPEPEEKPTQQTPPPVSEEAWEHKYHRLQGKYDAEVPRLHAQVKELQSYVEQLRTQLSSKPEAQPSETKMEKLVTDADVEAFGQDLIDVQRKVAREVAMEFKSEVDALKAENAELRKQMQQTGNQVAETSFEQRLHRLVPDFAALNADDNWVQWLDEVDPILRGPRRNIAQEAFNRGDAEGVAYYVSLYRQQNSTPAVDTKQAELQRQIQPSRSAAPTAPVSQKGKTYTTQDVEKMFQKITSLHSSQKFDEAKKLEAEIDAAYMEGRVTA